MTKKKIPLPLHRSTDPLHFRAMIDWCQARGLPVVRCSDFQAKTGPWNFYTRGSFHRDGDSRPRGMGFPAFKVAVEAWLEDEGLADAIKR